jgi:hypothetical protein
MRRDLRRDRCVEVVDSCTSAQVCLEVVGNLEPRSALGAPRQLVAPPRNLPPRGVIHCPGETDP